MDIPIPKQLQPFMRPKRIKIAFGGRGGFKTVSCAKMLTFLAARQKRNVLCAREFMNSIDESVHAALAREVSTLKMGHRFKVRDGKIDGYNGSKFRYAGLARNVESLKSRTDIDILWIEEAENLSGQSWTVMEPTVREDGSEIWITFNPKSRFSVIYETYVAPHIDTIMTQGFYEDEEIYVVKTSLADNPFANKILLDQSAKMKKDNPRKWLHVFGGELDEDYTDSVIKPEWVEAAIDAHKKLNIEPRGVKCLGFDPADTGDAKALVGRMGPLVTWIEEKHTGEFPDAVDWAFDTAYTGGYDMLGYDATGIGRGVKLALRTHLERKKLEVYPFEGGWGVEDPEEIYGDVRPNKHTFLNRRAQKHWEIRDRFERVYNAVHRGTFSDPSQMIFLSSGLPTLDALKKELVQVRRLRSNRSLIQVESKQDMIKRGLKSPNLFDALIISFCNPSPAPIAEPINFLSEF